MAKVINPNYHAIMSAYNKGLSGIVLEGGSGSGKTWAAIDAITKMCIDDNIHVNIIKEIYGDFKTSLYDDFNRRWQGIIQNPFGKTQDIHTYTLFGSNIRFLGADKDFEGKRCDVAWFNEALPIREFIFNNQEQRTRKFFIMDYNPNVTTHWIFDKVIPRPDVAFFKSTLLDNPFLSDNERRKILGYDPSNPVNVTNGTADDYMWSVYGIGKRAAMEGLIYKDVVWVDAMPECETYSYGEDFGYTVSDTAICKVGFRGNNLYAECLFYAPTGKLNELMAANEASIPDGEIVWCDSADPNYISQLRQNNIIAMAVVKPEIKFRINLVNQFKIHLIKNQFYFNVKKEVENYRWRILSGVTLPEPLGISHFLDALGYAVIMSNRRGMNQ